MFTGIVAAVGEVAELMRRGGRGRLRILAPAAFLRPLERGGSIAVSGCCLTATAIANGGSQHASFTADLAGETLRRTRFAGLRRGERVNLELPLRAGEPLGGHLVQGHVDGVGFVTAPRRRSGGRNGARNAGRLAVRLPVELLPYVAAQGSLAVEGVSLTVAAVEEDRAEFAIIPFTRAHTNLGGLRPGAAVNLEVDLLARYLARLAGNGTGGGDTAPAAGPRRGRTGLSVKEMRWQGF